MPPDRYREFVLDLASSLLLDGDVMPPREESLWLAWQWQLWIVAKCRAEK